MRTLAIIVIYLVAGCSPTTSDPARADLSERSSDLAPRNDPALMLIGLYTDEEIRELAKFDIDKESGDTPCLDVVPAGESYPRAKVFKTLNIDDARIRDFRHSGINFVDFLTWQVSPSYDICCMSANNDRENDGLEMTDPKRIVYGIRLVKRSK